MVIYKVTLEIKTSLWLKLLRFFRIRSEREEFEIKMHKDYYGVGDIIRTRECDLKVLKHPYL